MMKKINIIIGIALVLLMIPMSYAGLFDIKTSSDLIDEALFNTEAEYLPITEEQIIGLSRQQIKNNLKNSIVEIGNRKTKSLEGDYMTYYYWMDTLVSSKDQFYVTTGIVSFSVPMRVIRECRQTNSYEECEELWFYEENGDTTGVAVPIRTQLKTLAKSQLRYILSAQQNLINAQSTVGEDYIGEEAGVPDLSGI